MIKPISHLSMI